MAPTLPIFLLSCERSGSTLLRYILDIHPDICCPGELYMGRLVKCLRETVARTIGLAAGEKPEDQDWAAQREVHRMLSELMGKYAQIKGKKIWCDKTPLNLRDLAEIEWTFPEARYICLFRNSWDVVQSCLELPESQYIWWALPYIVKHQRNYAAAFLDSWVEKTENLLAFAVRNHRTCRIQYEALVADPVKALDPVFKFLELDWNPSFLDRVFEASHDLGGGDVKILSTDRIERDRVGKGSQINPTLLNRIPSELIERQKSLHLALGYPL